MSETTIWYGYLQAGEHSSPVVRDSSLQTRSRTTLYLFNYCRGKFLEYSREIVEPKLRELEPGDVPLKQLSSAFKAARKAFVQQKATPKWENTPPSPPPAPVREAVELDDLDDLDDLEEVPDDDFTVDMAEQ